MLALPREVTHDQALACSRMLAAAVRAAEEAALVVDASALERFDSSALAVLLGCRRDCLAAGKSLSVQGMPARLRELAALYGVAELLPAFSPGHGRA